MRRNNFQAADPVITAVCAQIFLIGVGFAALFGIKLAWLALRIVSYCLGIHL